ncbi:MAG TPA: hemerythrin domain-containing protein [Candidatus Acidoferrales bacterium]|nr:hemerythrin domain-containing protein [Candidatus Acidoferrales bacterium]
MKPPTATLRQEHEAIVRMLDAAEAVASQLERKQAVRPELLEGMGEFFGLFLDKCHHGKEEEILFPALRRKGMAVEGGPIGVMLREHDQGRSLAAAMRALTEAYKRGDQAAGAAWAAALREYSSLLREHILKENGVLFPMAEEMLSAEEETALAEEFDRVEDEKMGRGTHERLHARMAEIIREVAGEPRGR